MDRLTFAEWFKREYPLYERDGRDTSLKAALRIAWETAESQSLSQEAVRNEALEMPEDAETLEWEFEFSDTRRQVIRRVVWREDYDKLREFTIRSLKREPNAAATNGPAHDLPYWPVGGPAQGWILEPRELKLLIDYHDAKGCEAEAMGVNGSVRYHDKRRAHYEALLPPGASDE